MSMQYFNVKLIFLVKCSFIRTIYVLHLHKFLMKKIQNDLLMKYCFFYYNFFNAQYLKRKCLIFIYIIDDKSILYCFLNENVIHMMWKIFYKTYKTLEVSYLNYKSTNYGILSYIFFKHKKIIVPGEK